MSTELNDYMDGDRDLEERIQTNGRRIGHGEHVGFVNGLPAADRGAVEAETVIEHALFHFLDGIGVLLSRKV